MNQDELPMIRTFSNRSDSSYILGLFVFADWMTYPKNVPLLESEMDRLEDKDNKRLYLTRRQLKKIHANDEKGRGVIYDLDLTVPFKNTFNHCKVLAVETGAGNYMALYYFYNPSRDRNMTKIIRSQLGIVRFN